MVHELLPLCSYSVAGITCYTILLLGPLVLISRPSRRSRTARPTGPVAGYRSLLLASLGSCSAGEKDGRTAGKPRGSGRVDGRGPGARDGRRGRTWDRARKTGVDGRGFLQRLRGRLRRRRRVNSNPRSERGTRIAGIGRTTETDSFVLGGRRRGVEEGTNRLEPLQNKAVKTLRVGTCTATGATFPRALLRRVTTPTGCHCTASELLLSKCLNHLCQNI
eukprot:scaffold1821_cov344-Pavlova_lutheri.AAC.40